jgi:hypothetical protein
MVHLLLVNLASAEIRVFSMHFAIPRPQKKKRKAQSGGEAAASPPACAVGAFIGLHGQKRI